MNIQNIIDGFSKTIYDYDDVAIVRSNSEYKYQVCGIEIDLQKGFDAYAKNWYRFSYARIVVSNINEGM